MSDTNPTIKLETSAEIASRSENTPELKAYWEKRYKDLLESGYFTLSQKTIDLLLDNGPIVKPATPFGDLVLTKHIDKNYNLDEIALQSTIETAVRLLDSLVDGIKFSPEAKDTVGQYRKIGLGIADFKEYLEARKSPAELDEIDHIGHLVSEGAYRASENLAEEKGVCKNWSLVNKHLRPKSFEYWYNTDNGEVKSGLELADELDQSNIKDSHYQIVPRRNSNILLFPKDLEWQIWSDRDNTAAKTEITKPEPQNVEPTPAVQEPMAEPVVQEPVLAESHTEPQPQLIEDVPSLSNTTILEEEIPQEHEANQFLESLSQQEPAPEIEELPTETEQQVTTELPVFVETPDNEMVNQAIDEESEIPNIEQTQVHDNETMHMEAVPVASPELHDLEVPEALFQIGELVQIQDEQSEDFNKVFQVIDSQYHDNAHVYRLTGGGSELENKWWRESSISQVELIDILDKINTEAVPEIEISENIHLTVDALIFNHEDLLVETTDEGYILPNGMLEKDIVPEEAIERVLFDKYGITGQTVYEIGTSLELSKLNSPSKLHLGYVVEISELPEQDTLKWIHISDTALQTGIIGTLLEKWRSQGEYLNPEYNQAIQDTPLDQVQIESHTPAVKHEILSHTKTYSSMSQSKYSLKLEQLIKTNAFGDVIVSLQYDGQGPKLVAVNSDNLNSELKHLLDTVLGLVNFALAKKITPAELAVQLETEPNDGVHLPLNNLLKVVAASLKQAPSGVHEIDPATLLEIAPEMIQKMTEAPEQTGIMPEHTESEFVADKDEQTSSSSTPSKTEEPAKEEEKPRSFFGHFNN